MLGGFLSNRVGTAFAAGYVAALEALAPTGDALHRAAFAVTEDGGGHPRAIRTTLAIEGDVARLDGTKSFVTLSGEVPELLVAASIGVDEAGKNRLRLVRVPLEAPGVTLTAGATLPFAPEIPHGRVTLENVRVPASNVLSGDGYSRYVKPFRTIEDLHVTGALVGHVVRVARRFALPRELVLDALAIVGAASSLADGAPLAPATHLALAGVLRATDRLLTSLDASLGSVDEGVRARFLRDAPLRNVAGKARAARLESAWSTVGLGSPLGRGDAADD